MAFVLKIKPRRLLNDKNRCLESPDCITEDNDKRSFNDSYFSTINKKLLYNAYDKFGTKSRLTNNSSCLSKSFKVKDHSPFTNSLLLRVINMNATDNTSSKNIPLVTCSSQYSTTNYTDEALGENIAFRNIRQFKVKKSMKKKEKEKGFSKVRKSLLLINKSLNFPYEDNMNGYDMDEQEKQKTNINNICHMKCLPSQIQEDREILQNKLSQKSEKTKEESLCIKIEKLKEKIYSDNKTKLIINKLRILKPIFDRNAKNKFLHKKASDFISNEFNTNSFSNNSNMTKENFSQSKNNRTVNKNLIINEENEHNENLKKKKNKGNFLTFDLLSTKNLLNFSSTSDNNINENKSNEIPLKYQKKKLIKIQNILSNEHGFKQNVKRNNNISFVNNQNQKTNSKEPMKPSFLYKLMERKDTLAPINIDYSLIGKADSETQSKFSLRIKNQLNKHMQSNLLKINQRIKKNIEMNDSGNVERLVRLNQNVKNHKDNIDNLDLKEYN